MSSFFGNSSAAIAFLCMRAGGTDVSCSMLGWTAAFLFICGLVELFGVSPGIRQKASVRCRIRKLSIGDYALLFSASKDVA